MPSVDTLDLKLETVLKGIADNNTNNAVRMFFSRDIPMFLKELATPNFVAQTNKQNPHSREYQPQTSLAVSVLAIISKGEFVLSQLSDRAIKKRIKELFREVLAPWIENNSFIKRGLMKPRGYPGDYLMMEMGYRNQSDRLEGSVGGLDQFCFEHYKCILFRKDKIKKYLRDELIKKKHIQEMRILSLGGGSAREWEELNDDMESVGVPRETVTLTYLDQDKEAVSFAQGRLEKNHLIRSAEFRKETLLSFVNSVRWEERRGDYDFVYALGIADYFPDTMLGNVVKRSLTLLKKGARFVITHKDQNRFDFPILDWFCDWNFVRRSEEDFVDLVRRVIEEVGGEYVLKTEREASGEIIFVIVECTAEV